MSHRPSRLEEPTAPFRARLLALAAAALLVEGLLVAPAAAADPTPGVIAPLPVESATVGEAGQPPAAGTAPDAAEGAEARPSIHYEDSLAHADDVIEFTPGDRVTVGFEPRVGDTWPVEGRAPRALPAGRASGIDMSASPQGSTWAVTGRTFDPTPTDDPGPSADQEATDAPPAHDSAPLDAPADGAAQPADGASAHPPTDAPAAAPGATGLTKQVFGFLPYWELADGSTRLDYSVLSTVAYFSVGSDKAGNLLKKNADGSITTGWGGWTSSRLTSIISQAHLRKTRVVLTISMFAWTTGQATNQRALLGSPTARLNLARQAAAAVRDRGADGINLDFEPIASGYAEEFTALVRTVRAELSRISTGYQLTFDTTGYIGNYPIEGATAPGGADAIFIMGYDYRTSSSTSAGAISPLTGPVYDLTDTIRAFAARVPASKLILGVPYYGRAWSTETSSYHSGSQSGAKFGASAAVVYETAIEYAATYGRRWDQVEQTPWLAYTRENCTPTYGCVNSWRQIYYDDAVSLKLKYDAVNRFGLRGAGIWALGYDGGRLELYKALADKFLHDTTPPYVGIQFLPWRQRDAGFAVSWLGEDINGVASYDVQVSADGGAWATWLTGTTRTSDVFLGRTGHGYAFRARGRDRKGNVGPWNVGSTWQASPPLAVGGFAGVKTDGLSMRAAPDTAAQKIGQLSTGQIVSIIGGPRTADGYTWWQVNGPLLEWGPVSLIEIGAWVAAGTAADPWLVASRAPNTTLVDAVIRDLVVGDPSIGAATGVDADSRAFSPNGDGRRDHVHLAWTNAVALDSMTATVYRTDGTPVASTALGPAGAGGHGWDWDGTAGGTTVADGTYLVALTGTAAGVTYSAPSSRPVSPAQLAAYAVTVDRVPPTVTGATAGGAAFSPNGDGSLDTLRLELRGSRFAGWGFTAAPLGSGGPGAPVRTAGGTGTTAVFAWNGRTDGGALVPDGRYRLTLWATDAAGNPTPRWWDVTVDTRRPVVAAAAAPTAFSPNGDGTADTVALSWSADEAASGVVRVLRGSTVYKTWGVSAGGSLAWNGIDRRGARVPDAVYSFQADLVDPAGNRTVSSTTFTIDRTVGGLAWTPNLFFPQDGDAYAATSRVSFALARSAVTTLRVYSQAGAYVKTAWVDRSLGVGTWSWTWNGLDGRGAVVPRGWYRAQLTARSWLGTTTLTRWVLADAFSVVASPASPAGGQVVTLAIRSAEPLRSAPVVTFTQAGRAPVSRTATAVGGGRWRVAFVVATGAPGTATIGLTARDAAGRAVSQVLGLTVR